VTETNIVGLVRSGGGSSEDLVTDNIDGPDPGSTCGLCRASWRRNRQPDGPRISTRLRELEALLEERNG
jgi:hypothetical protein